MSPFNVILDYSVILQKQYHLMHVCNADIGVYLISGVGDRDRIKPPIFIEGMLATAPDFNSLG